MKNFENGKPGSIKLENIILENRETGNERKKYTFEEAVQLTGNGRIHLLLLLASGFALLGVITEGLNMSIVLPAARCDLHISTAEQAWINAVGFIGVVASSHFWGFLADTWGRRKVLLTALLSGFLFSTLSSISITTEMLLITRLLVGLSLSGVQASTISYLGEFHANANRLRAVSFVAMFMPMVVLYQAILGWIIMPMNWKFSVFGLFLFKPWRLFILCSNFINGVCFLILLFMPESPKFLLALGQQENALNILKWVYSINTGNSKESFPVKEIELEAIGSNLLEVRGIKNVLAMIWKQTWPLFAPPHSKNMFMLCYLQIIFYLIAHGIYLWYPMILGLYAANIHLPITTCQAFQLGRMEELKMNLQYSANASESLIQTEECFYNNDQLTFIVIVVLGLIFMVVYVFVALNINRFGPKLLLTSWICVCTAVGFSLVWANNFYLNTLLVIILLTCGNCGSVLSAVSADFFPTHYKGMALCLIMMSARIGSVTGSNIVGMLLTYNCSAIFYMSGGLLISGIVICFVLFMKPDNNPEKVKTMN